MTHTELETINESQFTELKELLEDDFVDLMTTFVSDSKGKILTLHQAYTDNDNLSAYDAVHSLKGAAANLGAPALAEACYRLQTECRENHLGRSQALIHLVETELEKVIAEVHLRTA